uniref:Uncharacterized protein n=1 Tax=Heterorhabditis bacteriophora TaxID=37862 RepID=A0A1I7XBK2_HETBA
MTSLIIPQHLETPSWVRYHKMNATYNGGPIQV